MFSDFKSRGFGVEDTHIHYPKRLGRLLLVMALALLSSDSRIGSPGDMRNGPPVQPSVTAACNPW
jgi:hypothetical protein